MKTAGQKFLIWHNNHVKINGCCPGDYDVNFYWTGGNLELEKQQIIDAYNDGQEFGFNKFGRDAEQYYNETFKD